MPSGIITSNLTIAKVNVPIEPEHGDEPNVNRTVGGMRFDPQAGFTPVDESPPAQPERPASSRGRKAATWAVVGVVVLVVWLVGLPVFAPAVLSAMRSAEEPAPEDPQSMLMSNRLSQALEHVARRDSYAQDAHGPLQVPDLNGIESADRPASDESDVAAASEPSHIAIRQAERLMARGQQAEALALLKRTRDAHPDDAEVRYRLGLACAMQRDYSGAQAELAELHKLDRSLASLLGNLVPKSASPTNAAKASDMSGVR